ncbi:SHOCT domain-containing protein [Kitasatospora sp. NBC_00240]|uniref:SHOCT domain-containing protein n=1 Tax=Kitasatospora sp. NBC_00240 TaxID=2903567 RepID=UPI002256FD7E|nr:SHOCT domain-containing protein [Kitasatospora sp. NBC_00240]MCX5212447.1 SHOCT domain-containing protein [Kitasatospora sp. NBC_00240]
MDWTDLIDVAFDVVGDGSHERRAAAVRTVEATIAPGERPVAATAARHPDHFRKGAMVLTTHRLLFLKDGKPPLPVPLEAVTEVRVNRTTFNGEVLQVIALTGAHRFEDVVKAEPFAEQLRAGAGAARSAYEAALAAVVPTAPAASAVPSGPATGEDLLDGLERLAALRAAGALTEEEFTRAKQRLIG